MSEIETLIAVAGTLGGTLGGMLLGYFLDERKATNRLRRETGLTPLASKQAAMKDAYNALADLSLLLVKASTDPQSHQMRLHEALDHFRSCVARAAIWMMKSPTSLQRLVDGEMTIEMACTRVFSGETLSVEAFTQSVGETFGKTAGILGKELRIDVMENLLQEFVKGTTR